VESGKLSRTEIFMGAFICLTAFTLAPLRNKKAKLRQEPTYEKEIETYVPIITEEIKL
jgi:hypothetical protein